MHCELVGFVHLVGREALEQNYFANYASRPFEWRLCVGVVDGKPELVCLREEGGVWKPWNAIRLEWRDGRVKSIRDFVHVPYLLHAVPVVVENRRP